MTNQLLSDAPAIGDLVLFEVVISHDDRPWTKGERVSVCANGALVSDIDGCFGIMIVAIAAGACSFGALMMASLSPLGAERVPYLRATMQLFVLALAALVAAGVLDDKLSQIDAQRQLQTQQKELQSEEAK